MCKFCRRFQQGGVAKIFEGRFSFMRWYRCLHSCCKCSNSFAHVTAMIAYTDSSHGFALPLHTSCFYVSKQPTTVRSEVSMETSSPLQNNTMKGYFVSSTLSVSNITARIFTAAKESFGAYLQEST
jgi:hypothetical protein